MFERTRNRTTFLASWGFWVVAGVIMLVGVFFMGVGASVNDFAYTDHFTLSSGFEVIWGIGASFIEPWPILVGVGVLIGVFFITKRFADRDSSTAAGVTTVVAVVITAILAALVGLNWFYLSWTMLAPVGAVVLVLFVTWLILSLWEAMHYRTINLRRNRSLPSRRVPVD